MQNGRRGAFVIASTGDPKIGVGWNNQQLPKDCGLVHYKQIRPDGKIYLATDMNIVWADRLPHEHPQYKKFLHSCDVVAASCRATQKYPETKSRHA